MRALESYLWKLFSYYNWLVVCKCWFHKRAPLVSQRLRPTSVLAHGMSKLLCNSTELYVISRFSLSITSVVPCNSLFFHGSSSEFHGTLGIVKINKIEIAYNFIQFLRDFRVSLFFHGSSAEFHGTLGIVKMNKIEIAYNFIQLLRDSRFPNFYDNTSQFCGLNWIRKLISVMCPFLSFYLLIHIYIYIYPMNYLQSSIELFKQHSNNICGPMEFHGTLALCSESNFHGILWNFFHAAKFKGTPYNF